MIGDAVLLCLFDLSCCTVRVAFVSGCLTATVGLPDAKF